MLACSVCWGCNRYSVSSSCKCTGCGYTVVCTVVVAVVVVVCIEVASDTPLAGQIAATEGNTTYSGWYSRGGLSYTTDPYPNTK